MQLKPQYLGLLTEKLAILSILLGYHLFNF